MKKIGIATVYTGYNYGSVLQAFATKKILSDMGYEAEILKINGSLVKGRDIRLKKLITIAWRSLLHKNGVKSLKNYSTSMSKEFKEGTVELFDEFINSEISPRLVSYRTLEKKAKNDEYAAFLCGSDQVWNSAVFYVDPFYYLRFAPLEKRIAFAPSFGRDFVPDYNKKTIKKYISEIKYKSVREASGIDIIKELTGEDSTVLIDPTLVLNRTEWVSLLNMKENNKGKYLLAYFLDSPSPKAQKAIHAISERYGLEIIGLPYIFKDSGINNVKNAGPCEFVEYVKNASFVCTDSFHGTAFSLNLNIPFFTFERKYGNGGNQSARIESILKMTDHFNRYEVDDFESCMDISFEKSNTILDFERRRSKEYLASILEERV